MSPVIWYLLEKGAFVHLFCVGDVKPSEDRVAFLKSYPNARVYDATSRPDSRWAKRRKSLYNTLPFLFYFMLRHRIGCVAGEWARPEYGVLRGKAFWLAKRLGIKTLVLPHGYNVFTNDDINDLLKENMQNMPWQDRNVFDYYCNCTDRHVEHMVRMGIDPAISRTIGSCRFAKEWSRILLERVESEEWKRAASHFEKDCVNVLFMTPHWDYNSHRDETIRLINEIAAIDGVNVVIKQHTRGTGSLAQDEVYPSVKLADESSCSLISHCDVSIICGSSIMFEALLQGKIAVNPTYLHSNQTIFDSYEGVLTLDSPERIFEMLRNMHAEGSEYERYRSMDHTAFLDEHISNGTGRSPFALLDDLVKEIEAA